MRAILFLFLVICAGFFAQAQDSEQPKVKTMTMPVVQSIDTTNVAKSECPTLAGVFVLKNSRVKRALTFKTRKRDAKLV
ncbi:hypothetical protein [Maribacter aestuarii]|uniref:hypothetical protein n=1 Tax=Maribacter aestuarii TaxID=1130723 RepID=UPI00248CA527|nr:hypothetical protein [Maribacter aestuarii]